MAWNRADAIAILDAILTDGAPQPVAAAERLGMDAEFALMSAASMVAVWHRFGHDVAPGTVRDYVAETLARFPRSSTRIKPAVMERFIHAQLGAQGQLYGIDASDLIPTMFFLMYAIMSDQRLDTAHKSAYYETVLAVATGGGWCFEADVSEASD